MPSVVSAGFVDIASGRLVAQHPVGRDKTLETAASASSELLARVGITMPDTHLTPSAVGPATPDPGLETVVVSEQFVHVFRRVAPTSNMALVIVCKPDVNLGMVLARSRVLLSQSEV